MKRFLTGLLCLFTVSYSDQLPEILVIPDFSYVYRDISDERYSSLYVPNFVEHVQHQEHGFNQKNGFNLNYVEFKIDYHMENIFFRSVLHFTENKVDIDEAYIGLPQLPYGITAKVGKFRSEIGIINSHHQHRWFFTDIPLIYQLIFGYHGLSEKGAQIEIKKSYGKAGIEVLQGENENSFGYQAVPEYSIKESKAPNLSVFYLKLLDAESSFKPSAGFSFLKGTYRNVEEPSQGDTQIYGWDFSFSVRGLKFQGELFYRKISGYTYSPEKIPFTKKQAGYYIQTVYPINRNVSAGVRYENIFKNQLDSSDITKNLEKFSLSVNLLPVENIKIRLQYSYDRSKFFEGRRKGINQITAEITAFAGKHHH